MGNQYQALNPSDVQVNFLRLLLSITLIAIGRLKEGIEDCIRIRTISFQNSTNVSFIKNQVLSRSASNHKWRLLYMTQPQRKLLPNGFKSYQIFSWFGPHCQPVTGWCFYKYFKRSCIYSHFPKSGSRYIEFAIRNVKICPMQIMNRIVKSFLATNVPRFASQNLN